MKKMQRIIPGAGLLIKGILLAAALLLSAGCATRSGPETGTAYALGELRLRAALPAGLYVVTRDETSHGAEEFAALGIDLNAAQAVLEERNIYLSAIAPDSSYEYILAMGEAENYRTIGSLSRFSNEELYSLADSIVANYTDLGVRAQADDLFSPDPNRETVWVVLDLVRTDAAGNPVYIRQYYTVVNGQAVEFNLNSYAGPLSQALRDEFETVIEGIVYTR
jgi:hypothetical protein